MSKVVILTVNNPELTKEFRFKSGSKIMSYIKHFSLTEKTVFVIFIITLFISAFMMLEKISDFFMTKVPTVGGELREGVVGLPHYINPVLAITDVDRDISSLIYSGLMKYKGDTIVKDLAESYSISNDGLIYTFKLRPNIMFHDGTPLTTADIAFTIQKIQSTTLKSPKRADWNNVEVMIVSPLEIKFILKQPYSPFITNTVVGILPKHIWDNFDDEQFVFSEFNIKPIGSGPYKMKTLIRNSDNIPEELKLVVWKKSAYINSISFVFYSDQDKSILALERGAIDSLASLSPKQAENFQSKCLQDVSCKDKYSIISTPLPRIFGVFFNQSHNPILADKNVRQALSISLDRSKIISEVLGSYGKAVYGPIPYLTSTSDKNQTDKPNLELASSILEKAGWKKNAATGIYEKKISKNTTQTLSFNIFTADTTDLKKTAELIKETWTTLGASVEIKIFESSDLYQNIIRPRKYDSLLFGQLIGKDRDIYAFWHSSQRNAPGLNVSMYTNSKADTLLETIRQTTDANLLTEKYKELNKIIQNDVPAIFLYSPHFIYLLPKILQNNKDGMTLNNITTPTDRWNSITDWYLVTEKIWNIFIKK